jgi:hypothetical protein
MRRVTGVLVLASCVAWISGPWAAVSVEIDDDLQFSSYATYAWRPGKPAQHTWVQDQIVRSVEDALEGRGLRKVDDAADVYVQTYALIDEHTLQELADPVQWEFWTGVSSVDLYTINIGSLVVDLVDGRTERMVFRGLVTETAAKTTKKTEQRIHRAVMKVFGRIPAP